MLGCIEILPKPTESGKNTFGCKINGEKFIPEKKELFSGPPVYGYFGADSSFYLVGDVKPHTISLRIKKITKTGDYILSDKLNRSYYINYKTFSVYYLINQQNTGRISISRVDYSKRIVSGTFEFEAFNEKDPTDIVKITKGRFDIDFTTLK